MKVLFISNGVWEFDGRMRELKKISEKLGECNSVFRVKSAYRNFGGVNIGFRSSNFFVFIIKAIFTSLKMSKIDIMVVDNRKAIIPALIIKILKSPSFIVQDVRELYFFDEVHHISGKLGCLFESFLLKRANLVICANNYRATIMQEKYDLKEKPIVYENIRKMEYCEEVDISVYVERYREIFGKYKYYIISTSGYSVSRTNNILVKAMLEFKDNVCLILVGGGSDKDKNVIERIISENNLNNVVLYDAVDESELKYLVSNVHIGVVNYHQNDTNNKYCASGKIYEYIFEGLPVITTENLPLVEICDKYSIGIADSKYSSGIRKIISNYEFYQDNVNKLKNELDVNKYNSIKKSEILSRLGIVNGDRI